MHSHDDSIDDKFRDLNITQILQFDSLPKLISALSNMKFKEHLKQIGKLHLFVPNLSGNLKLRALT